MAHTRIAGSEQNTPKPNRSGRGWIFTTGGIVIFCLLLMICSGGGYLVYKHVQVPLGATSAAVSTLPPGSGGVPAEFTSLADLVSLTASPKVYSVDNRAQQIHFETGLTLRIPAGAFPGSNQLLLRPVEIAFDRISFDAKKSPFYVLSPIQEVGPLGSPLTLSILVPTGDVVVVEYDGKSWQLVQGKSGETIQLQIPHFSNFVWGFIEGRSEQDLREGLAQNPSLAQPPAQERRHIEAGDDLTKAFFGVGESATMSQEEMCSDIISVLAEYNRPENLQFPSAATGSNLDLASFLFAGSSPESTGGYYYELTEASMDTIQAQVMASTAPLSPADVLKIAIDANGGSIPLGVLAAHNYLKNIKYNGLAQFHYGKPFPTYEGGAASHLASWREGSNITPAGEYDKMGPIYHIFAAMTAGVWFPTEYGGHIAVNGEAMLRSFRFGGDRPDLQKAAADDCGDNAAVWLRDNPPTAENNPTATNPPAATPQQVTVTGTVLPEILDPGKKVTANSITITYWTDGSGQVTGTATYGTYYSWDNCNIDLPDTLRWELTGTFDPATEKFSGSADEYSKGQIAYTDCSVSALTEYKNDNGGSWEATLMDGVVKGSIWINQSAGYPPIERVAFEAK